MAKTLASSATRPRQCLRGEGKRKITDKQPRYLLYLWFFARTLVFFPPLKNPFLFCFISFVSFLFAGRTCSSGPFLSYAFPENMDKEIAFLFYEKNNNG